MIFPFLKRRRVQGEGFVITLGAHGRLVYEEGADRFLINAIKGNGYGIVVEQMADLDLALQNKSSEIKRTIALKIKYALSQRGITVDVYEDNRPVTS